MSMAHPVDLTAGPIDYEDTGGDGPVVVLLLERLDLDGVTLVGNDTGGALVQLLAAGGNPRIGRIILVSCDAFDNVPPGLTGKTLVASGRLSPRLFGLFMQQLRMKPVRRLPIAFGWLTKRGDAATRRWLEPVLHQQAIRRDAVRELTTGPSVYVPGHVDRG
jgi:pimeloyl-ACP methyl ester carboxylesterase